MGKLRDRHISLINNTKLDFERYLLHELPWNERLVGIKGSRGVGKTTLILQYIKKKYDLSEKALYISLDDIYFAENTIVDFVDDFVSKGGEHLFIDEVHKYKNWAREIKNIYDYHPKLKMVFTGSSLLEILNERADLSKRALVFTLQGLSFREYLKHQHNIELDRISLDEILYNHTKIALEINKKLKPLAYFDDYLEVGYYPFYKGNKDRYYQRLQEVVNMILEIELPLLRNTDISIIGKMKQLLYIISQSVPFKPNITSLANKTQVTRKTILDYINYLNDAGIIKTLHKDTFGVSALQKPSKLYLENTNFSFMLSQEVPNKGNLRETFFLNQLSNKSQITYPDKGDFLVDRKYTFEIGGKNKTVKQITGIDNAYIVADNIEFGSGNKIPLWLFGFMY